MPADFFEKYHLQCSMKNQEFFLENAVYRSHPFIIFYRRSQADYLDALKQIEQGKMKASEYLRELGIPESRELVTFYEDYLSGKYSSTGNNRPKSISFMGHKLFVIQYDQYLLHATDGMDLSLLALPIFPQTNLHSISKSQILLRFYKMGEEKYETILQGVSEMQEALSGCVQ